MLKTYLWLTKPGIIMGNTITAAAGFLLAAQTTIHFAPFLAMLVGLAAIIGSACVINNYLDRHIDRKMARTKNRAIASGRVSGRAALIYAAILAFIGATILGAYTNPLTVVLALLIMPTYDVLYTFGKRRSVHGTLIGTIPGALPPVVGYTAVTGQFDLGAALIFLILVVWQMPHFYAIAIYRLKDYQAAGIPVLPAVAGIKPTKIQMFAYIIAFIIAASLLTVFGYTGYFYLIVTLTLGLIWLKLAREGFQAADDRAWAARLFKLSIRVLTGLSVAIPLDAVFR